MNIKVSRLRAIKHAIVYFTYLFILWGFYRRIFQFPESIEELIFKPAIWLIPLFILLRREKDSLPSIGLGVKNFFPTIYLTLILGTVFAIEAFLLNYLKYGQFVFEANLGESGFGLGLVVSFATAISEELAFRGYIFTRLWKGLGGEWRANILTSIFWVLIHLSIAIFDWKLAVGQLIVYLVLVFIYSLGAGFIFARTKNVTSSILLHLLWQWPIILFR